jgi:hypothetical protein
MSPRIDSRDYRARDHNFAAIIWQGLPGNGADTAQMGWHTSNRQEKRRAYLLIVKLCSRFGIESDPEAQLGRSDVLAGEIVNASCDNAFVQHTLYMPATTCILRLFRRQMACQGVSYLDLIHHLTITHISATLTIT